MLGLTVQSVKVVSWSHMAPLRSEETNETFVNDENSIVILRMSAPSNLHRSALTFTIVVLYSEAIERSASRSSTLFSIASLKSALCNWKMESAHVKARCSCVLSE